MIDSRFYETLGPVTVRALSSGLHAEGEVDREIRSLAPLSRATPFDLAYFDAPAPRSPLEAAPGACIVRAEAVHATPRALAHIVSPSPRATFARIAQKLVRPRIAAIEQAGVHPDAQLEPGVAVGAGAVIGPGAQIGEGARIGPNTVIGPGVAIGRRTRIGANCVIAFALIGDDVQIFSGVVIGEAGFGVTGDSEGVVDVPHFGRAIVQDRVTIGSNSCVDRGQFDDTIIGEEAKIDNLCHIGHNVTVGRRTLIAAYGGISGSTTIGDDVRMGGRVGVSDHRTIGDGASLAGGSAVLQDVPAGETWGGYPAKPARLWMREIAWLKSKVSGKRDDRK
ncbi:MAG: UDP-3-O-(3-hydroxymyristoyl)glucosamine N-acyltransferase [Hyphomonadaceae bacterium]